MEADSSLAQSPPGKHDEEDESTTFSPAKWSVRIESWVAVELQKQLWLAGPMIAVNFLEYSLLVVSVMFVGHMGELSLAGASLASSFSAVTGFSLLVGMGCALETLGGQAFGAGNFHMVGIYLQRGILVLFLTSIPVSFLWWNMTSILISFGQNADIAAKAGQYSRFLIPSLFAYAFVQPLVKFLQAQSLVAVMSISSLATLCFFHIPLCYLLIFQLEVGFHGAAIATSISNWVNVLILASYIKLSPHCKLTWTGFSILAFQKLPALFKLAIPSAIMVCLECWSFELLVLFSGYLPNPTLETSTLAVCLTTSSLVYMIPYGLGAATSTRVANELGGANPQGARRAVAVSLGLAMVEGLGVLSFLLLVRNEWAWLFTSDEDVAAYVARVMPMLAGLSAVDAVQGVLTGVVRGAGWQVFGAVTNLCSYYGVGLPLGGILAFGMHYNDVGFWVGLTSGIVVQALILAVATARTEWEQQAQDAASRVGAAQSWDAPYVLLE